MLNPQRWGATTATRNGYVKDFEKGGTGTLFEIGGDDDEDEPPNVRDVKGHSTQGLLRVCT